MGAHALAVAQEDQRHEAVSPFAPSRQRFNPQQPPNRAATAEVLLRKRRSPLAWLRVYIDRNRMTGTGWAAYGIGADLLLEDGSPFRSARPPPPAPRLPRRDQTLRGRTDECVDARVHRNSLRLCHPLSMGAWGTGIFDDDSAYDFADELSADALAFFRHSFEVALASQPVGVDASHAVTVSAAYVDAILHGTRYRNDDQRGFDAFIASHKSMPVAELKPLAALAIARVLDGSDLDEEWRGAEKHAEWRAVLSDLQARLSASR